MEKYSPAIEQKMKNFYNTLSEKDKRHYAGIEALKLGHGGIVYISDLLGCSRNTTSRGIKESEYENNEPDSNERVRKSGGGRKNYGGWCKGSDKSYLIFEQWLFLSLFS